MNFLSSITRLLFGREIPTERTTALTKMYIRLPAERNHHTQSPPYDALWLRTDRKTSKPNIFAPNREKLMKFLMNTTNVCLHLMAMIFFSFF